MTSASVETRTWYIAPCWQRCQYRTPYTRSCWLASRSPWACSAQGCQLRKSDTCRCWRARATCSAHRIPSVLLLVVRCAFAEAVEPRCHNRCRIARKDRRVATRNNRCTWNTGTNKGSDSTVMRTQSWERLINIHDRSTAHRRHIFTQTILLEQDLTRIYCATWSDTRRDELFCCILRRGIVKNVSTNLRKSVSRCSRMACVAVSGSFRDRSTVAPVFELNEYKPFSVRCNK